MEFITFLTAAVFIEGLVEYLFKEFVNGKLVKYVALAIGIVFAIVYRLDLMVMFGFKAFSPYVGYIVTGLIIGRGSNYVNDFVSRWTEKPTVQPINGTPDDTPPTTQ